MSQPLQPNSPQIDIVYALPRKQIVKQVTWHEGMTVSDAIQASQITDQYPDMTIADGKVGIFGKAVKLSQILKQHDRIEIYRPLINDPKEMRRRKAVEAEKNAQELK